ncbi:MAG: glycoside hydrolase family 9 protein [Cellulomonas sp.]|uniref:glycoside hydrolase family 9 protein n=1 Tax=Cellulomonas sp. 73-92 TaxID=1895740 RepID=UPI000B21D2EA|nr:glycoside hydrolase family 9 protein [Cellulomonas sp. 73-92]MBN9374519.1 glycoside hydrolase family 9 protein [Cellulomonas sp.]
MITSRVHVNQVGYLTGGPKGATLVCAEDSPQQWQLRAATGEVLAEGDTVPRGLDPSSGSRVHTVDFSAVRTPAARVHLVADGATSPSFAIGGGLYDRLLHDALTVFTLQRSGVAIGADVAGAQYARAAGHLGMEPNLGDTQVSPLPRGAAFTNHGADLYAGWSGDYVVDGSGGWYDAGDQGKYVVNGGIAVAQLLGLVERALRAGQDAGPGTPAALALDEARWELDWMVRMQVAPGLRLAGMVHHKLHDERWTPLPTLPALDPQRRFVHRPSTAATLNLAAVAAQVARLMAVADPEYAARMLEVARTAYRAARANPVLLAPDTNVIANFGGGPYNDSEVDDEFYWAAAELYLTTGEAGYLADLRDNPYHLGGAKPAFVPQGFDWRDVAAWARMQLAVVDSPLPERDEVRVSLVGAAEHLLAHDEPFGHLYSPPDGRYAWGSNGMVANCAGIVAAASDVSGDPRLRDGALAGIDYLLGRNAMGLSYVTGHGSAYAHHQHSRWYARSLDPSLPDPPPGTLSGGPNSDVPDPVSAPLAGRPAQRCYVDDVQAFGVNEMAVNWNSALAWLVAFAASQGDGLPAA